MNKNRFSLARPFLAALGVFLSVTPTLSYSRVLINGAGATFPYPLYSKWISDYEKVDPKVRLNYQSVGSGGGIRQFMDRTVDFGATDAPLTEEQEKRIEVGFIHVPTILGAVVLAVNVPGVEGSLNLSSEVVAGLYLGKIQKWNDEKILALNPEVKLPDLHVMVAYRSDGSGTTAVFTDYLSKVSDDWKKNVGHGTAIRWPIGIGGRGNEGVSNLVKQTPGAIGYIELAYAKNNNLSTAKIQNHEGNFIEASAASITAAADALTDKIPANFKVSITNPTGTGAEEAYPIAAFTYLLIYEKLPKGKGERLLEFIQWALEDGQKSAEALLYAPLPPALVARVKERLKGVELE
jgi:phosphate transport system substrate-binding protein